MKTIPRRLLVAALASTAAALAGCGGGGSSTVTINTLPANVMNVVGPTSYDGSTDDLLTAGLGKTGLAGAAPGFADPVNPTAAELRRRVIYTNYRAVLDISAAGGYGTLYGPNIDVNGNDTLGEGKIAGKEYLAYVDDGTGKKNVTIMVQIPASFDAANPCIIAAPSSGSRGVYGAIGSAGEWGLKHKCAVAYTDAGKGIGYQDLAADKVNLIQGQLVARSSVSPSSLVHFATDLTGAALAAFNAAFPNRVAYKHVYSQQNPEKDWGKNVLDSIRFAFWALNENYAPVDGSTGKHTVTITAANTIVIASSISNGGSESLQALEQDTEGLIDGLAVTEPNANVGSAAGLTVTLGGAPQTAGKTLIDYFTYRSIYELCASLSVSAQAPTGVRPGWFGGGTNPGALLGVVGGMDLNTIGANRCQSLADKGLISGAGTAQLADAALAKMQAYGWTDPNQNALHASHFRAADFYVTFGYVVAYGKFSVGDNVCGFSLAGVNAANGDVAAQVAATQASLFSTANGLGGNGGIEVVYNDSAGGAKWYLDGVSPSTGRADASLDGMLCLRNLVMGVDTVTGAALAGNALAQSQRVQAGIHDILLTGNLRGKPAIIATGRSDTLVNPNHSARAYVAFNSKVEAGSNLRYYEIQNGQHFDAFVPSLAAGTGINGYDTLFVPVHYYFINAMDLMWARLKTGAALPPSQLVRTTPRGGTPGAAPPITAANVPKIAANPAAADAIGVGGGTINVP